jgi:uncharacterized membrane protein YhfC
MPLFEPQNRNQSPQAQHVYALYEIAHVVVELLAALSFLVGSILFFKETTQTAGIWFYVIGSVLFAIKPTLRLAREIKLLVMGRNAAADEPTNDQGDPR